MLTVSREDILVHREWSEPATADWLSSRGSSIGEPDNFNQSGSPPNPNHIVANILQPTINPVERPSSPLPQIHHATSNPIGIRTAGYSGTLPPRPSSSPAEDVDHDVAPAPIEHSKLHTYMGSFRHRHDINHGPYQPPDQPLAQPKYLYPSRKSPEQSPWQSSHGDSGYHTESGSYPLSHLSKETIQARMKAQPMLIENPRPYASDPLFNNYASDRNHIPTEFIGPLNLHQVRVNTKERHLKVSPLAKPSLSENNLIDFDEPNPGPEGNIPYTPQHGPPPLQGSVGEGPLFGPWLPFENPWT